jgi:hypothetical protein
VARFPFKSAPAGRKTRHLHFAYGLKKHESTSYVHLQLNLFKIGLIILRMLILLDKSGKALWHND